MCTSTCSLHNSCSCDSSWAFLSLSFCMESLWVCSTFNRFSALSRSCSKVCHNIILSTWIQSCLNNNNNNAMCALIVLQARKVQRKHLVTFGNIWKNHTIPCTQRCKHVITKVFVLLSACKNLAMFTRHFSFTPIQKHLVCNFFWCLNKLQWPMFWNFYYCKQIMFYGWKILCFNCIQIHIAIKVSRYCSHFCYTQMFILVTNMKLTWLPPNSWKHKTFPAEHSPLTIIHNKFKKCLKWGSNIFMQLTSLTVTIFPSVHIPLAQPCTVHIPVGAYYI